MYIKLAFIIVIALTVAACSGGGVPPTAPMPPARPQVPGADPPIPAPVSRHLWVMVFPRNSGQCIPGASVEVVSDGRVVQSAAQITPCDGWDGDGGIWFYNLPDEEVTLRARAAGYLAEEITATPVTGNFTRLNGISLRPAN